MTQPTIAKTITATRLLATSASEFSLVVAKVVVIVVEVVEVIVVEVVVINMNTLLAANAIGP